MPPNSWFHANKGWSTGYERFTIRSLPLAIGLALTGCNDSDNDETTEPNADDPATSQPASVVFTSTAAPGIDNPERMTTSYTESEAIVIYADGSKKTFPLSYNVLFENVAPMVGGSEAAAQLYDVAGNPLTDPNGDPVIAETPDANSLLSVNDELFLVTN